MARSVGDRAAELFGNNLGTITEVHEFPNAPGIFEYTIEWDDGKFPGERWNEQELWPVSEEDSEDQA